MSLTSHLADAESSVRKFILAKAPELALAGTRGADGKKWAERFGFDGLSSLETRIPIPPDVEAATRQRHATTAGIAVDYRIRMDLPEFDISQTTAKRGLDRLALDPDVIHRGKHILRTLRDATLGLAYLTLQEKNPHPLSLARASVPMAWCESIFRAGPVAALENDLGKQIKRAKGAADLMMSIERSLLFDIAHMHRPIENLLTQWRQDVAQGAYYAPNPSFMGSFAVGGADGDLIIDDLLVEVKTREEVTNPWLRETLFQLLGYALLDLDDAHGIRRVGIMLPRQSHLQIWSLDEFFGTDAEYVLPVLRNEFAVLLSEILERPVH
jgi:hypothetical protein